ncbi:hypothetical protein EXN66_Car000526 [Channa argus]|uniref:Uncharacterized protein n=1 Tax=Channa argus TaxID=215402 RepID=A0A6G1QYG4_CHAAH|nr:hypothetical protein EXN66_Car000526 [Channa argus]
MFHKKQAVGQEDSCTRSFHFIPTPLQKASGKIKGHSTGTLARFFSFPLLFIYLFYSFWDGKGSFKPLRIILAQDLYQSKGHVKTLHTIF